MKSHPDDLNLEEQRWLTIVRDLLRGLRFGVVQIVVQDAKVVHVEKTEKVRIASN